MAAPAGPSLRQLVDQAARRLAEAGIDRARAEARLLVGHALGLSLENVLARDSDIVDTAAEAKIAALVARRLRREPMAQILGWREFYGRRFRVGRDVLTPRPDSETLVEAVLARLRMRDGELRLLELGVGSGCLLLTLLAELPRATGLGIDISPAALEMAKSNAQMLGVTGRAELRHGDWSASVSGRFDALIANPPYIVSDDIAGLEPEVAQYEPRLALDGGPDGLVFYKRLIGDLDRLVETDGFVALEVGVGQAAAVAGLLAGAGFGAIARHRDLAGIERCVIAARR
ncbi:MAG: peptide chain release factor N(5)-glutamine methyltransferase [Reyranellaceae bacterium]